MVSGLLFAELFGISRSLILSIIPKSITTPVAIQIASGIGGVPSMTVVFVMIAGFSGVILGPLLLKWIRIRSSLGKGIAFGSASHALGTSKAMEYGELTVSMSSVSMTLCAVLGSVFYRRSMDVSNLKLTVLRQLFHVRIISFPSIIMFHL